MSRQIKRKYKQTRLAFKNDLLAVCEDNNALAMLIIETYAAWHHKRHITQIWSMFRNPDYSEFQADYSKNLMGKHLCGREDIWRSLYFTEKELYTKYKGKIPETYALGDALGVAYRVLQANQNKER